MFGIMLLVISLAPGEPRSSELFPEILVRGRAIRIEESEDSQKSIFSVEYVYAGGAQLRGERFECEARRSLLGSRTAGSLIYPPVKVGDVGIWVLRKQPDDMRLIVDLRFKEWTSVVASGANVRKEVRQVDGQEIPYNNALEWGRCVEEAWSVSPERRSALLREHCLSQLPEVACWAIQVLGRGDGATGPSFLASLVANEKLCIEAQVTLDEQLSRRRGEDWRTAKDRMRMLNGWIIKGIGGKSEYAIIGRLNDIGQIGEMEYTDFLHLIGDALKAKSLPRSSGLNVFGVLQNAISTKGNKQKRTFEFLVSQIGSGKEAYVRVGAARLLAKCAPLSQDQTETLERLRGSTEEEVSSALGEVLRVNNKK